MGNKNWRYKLDEKGAPILNDQGAAEPYLIDDRTLDEAKAEAIFNLTQTYESLWVSPAPYQGDFIQLDQDSREDIAAYKAVASDAIAGLVQWPNNFAWKMLSNDLIPLPTPQDMISLAMIPVIRNTELFNRMRVAKAAIRAAGNNEEVDNVIF